MKEFYSLTGGRYTYTDDIYNLQEMSLALSTIFDGCGNFVISGCRVEGNRIGSGYVYLNGKIRYFSGSSAIYSFPQYIYEVNRIESVPYASGGSKYGRKVYGCSIGSTVPSSLDPVTNLAPSALPVSSSGARTIKDAFFGKYALLLDAQNANQVVKSNVTFNGDVKISKTITSQEFKIGDDSLSKIGGKLSLVSKVGGASYKLEYSTSGFVFYVNDSPSLTVGRDKIQCSVPLSCPRLFAGAISVSDNNIYNWSNATDSGCLNINMVGHNGETSYFRDLNIGDGKGTALLSIKGSDKLVTVNGQILVKNDNHDSLVIQSRFPKGDNRIVSAIVWKDKSGNAFGQAGFVGTDNNDFLISNTVGEISISGYQYVDLGPAIKENGVLLSTKYVLKTDFDDKMSTVALSENVYSKEDTNSKFASKSLGFLQFITPSVSAEKLLGQIGALGQRDANKFALKSNFLSDMASSEEDKKTIRTNIGAVGGDECQKKLKDTGWETINNSGNELYVRQVGNVVNIHGRLMIQKQGELAFTLPGGIDWPPHHISASIMSHGDGYCCLRTHTQSNRFVFTKLWSMKPGHLEDFLLTYMV